MNYKLWLNGNWADSEGGSVMRIENPANGEQIAEVPKGSRKDVDRAVRAAHEAFHDGRWSKKTPGERSLVLWRLADLLEARTEEFARVESHNTGKPYTFASLGEAVRLGNDVLYGLAASVFTKDIGRAMRLSAALEFGTVWINDHIPLTSETPHGGFKQSGFGKDLSAEAVGDYQITKHVMVATGQ